VGKRPHEGLEGKQGDSELTEQIPERVASFQVSQFVDKYGMLIEGGFLPAEGKKNAWRKNPCKEGAFHLGALERARRADSQQTGNFPAGFPA